MDESFGLLPDVVLRNGDGIEGVLVVLAVDAAEVVGEAGLGIGSAGMFGRVDVEGHVVAQDGLLALAALERHLPVEIADLAVGQPALPAVMDPLDDRVDQSGLPHQVRRHRSVPEGIHRPHRFWNHPHVLLQPLVSCIYYFIYFTYLYI